jgi:hypothetical protein
MISKCLPGHWVGVIFLRGGDGAKDGQKLVGAQQQSKEKAGKEEVLDRAGALNSSRRRMSWDSLHRVASWRAC